MADNITYSGTGSSVPANTKQRVDQLADGSAVPYVKLLDGTDDSEAVIKGDATNGLDVDVTRVQGTVTVDGSGHTQPISAAALPLPSGAATSAKQPALGTAGTPSADVLTVQGITSMTPLKTDGSGVTQPVSGTVSITANSAVNVAQLAGTATDTNSGNKSAGTLRVVIATDQPQTTTAFKVDGSAVTQPVSGTVSATLSATTNAGATAITADYDSGAGTQTATMFGLALPASGGAVAGGTSTNPVRIDPTGTTTQPISAASLPLPSGASTAAKQPALGTAGSASSDVITVQGIASMTALKVDGSAVTQPVSGTVTANAGTGTMAVAGNSASGASDSGNPVKVGGKYNSGGVTLTDGQRGDLQLDASGFVKVNVAAGGGSGGTSSSFGSAFPSTGTAIGAKDSTGTNMAALNLDASGFLKVNVAAGGGSGGTSSTFGSADPGTGTAAGFSDGTNMREARVFDVDTGAGTQYVQGVNLRKAASGGSVEAGTSSDPLRVDPTGTTAQPVTDNGGSLTVDNGGTFAVQDSEKVVDNAGFTDGTTKVLPAGFIFDETAGTALTENDAAAARIDSKRAQVLVLEDATTRGQRATVTASNALKVDGSAVTQPVSGTLTGITNVVHVDDNSGSLTVDVADATASGNLTSTTSVTASSLNGANTAAVQITGTWTATVQFEGSVDGSNFFSVNAIVFTTGALVTSATANGQWQVDVAGLTSFRVRCSAFTSGTIVVTIRSSVTGSGALALDAPLPAGTNVIGALSANQSVNVAQINGVAATMGNGASGTGVQRVTIANDSTGVLATVSTVTNVATIGTSVTPGTSAAHLGKAEDAAHASGDTGVMMLAVRQDTLANSTSTDGDYGAIKLTTAGRVYTSATVDAALPAGTNALGTVTLDDAGTGWSSHSLTSAASANATNVKGSAGRLHGVEVFNSNASARYLKLYNSASAPTAGSGTPFRRYMIPAGGGLVISYPSPGITFSSGLGYTLVTGAADSNSTGVAADEIQLNLSYT